MIGEVIETTATIIQILIWSWFITKFFGFKSDKYKAGYWIVSAIVIVEIVFINHIIPYDGILTGVAVATYIIYAHICLKGNIYFHLFITLFSTAVIFALAGAIMMMITFVSGQDITQQLTEFSVWRIVLFVPCRILEYAIFAAVIRLNDEYALTNKEWALFVAVPFCAWYAVTLMVSASMAQPEILPYMFRLILVIIAICALIYYFMIKIKEDASAASELARMRDFCEEVKVKEANMQALYDTIYSLKHDLEKHFVAIRVMAEKNMNNDIADYTKEVIKDSFDNTQKIIFTDNGVFNAIINTRMEICRVKNISCSINVSDEALECIKAENIAVLFGNIFDNAIEAAEKSDEKLIRLNVRCQNRYVSIVMENSFNSEFSGVGHETSKPNRREHGYGLRNVKKIVEKYNGMMKCDDDGDTFCCDILLGIGF